MILGDPDIYESTEIGLSPFINEANQSAYYTSHDQPGKQRRKVIKQYIHVWTLTCNTHHVHKSPDFYNSFICRQADVDLFVKSITPAF